jgi:hypothetical protein
MINTNIQVVNHNSTPQFTTVINLFFCSTKDFILVTSYGIHLVVLCWIHQYTWAIWGAWPDEKSQKHKGDKHRQIIWRGDNCSGNLVGSQLPPVRRTVLAVQKVFNRIKEEREDIITSYRGITKRRRQKAKCCKWTYAIAGVEIRGKISKTCLTLVYSQHTCCILASYLLYTCGLLAGRHCSL